MAGKTVRRATGAWLAAVVGLFLFVHPPAWRAALSDFAGPASAGLGEISGSSLLRRQAALGWAVLVFLAATAACRHAGKQLGRWAGGPARAGRPPAGTSFAVDVLLGWTIAAAGLFGLAACGLFRLPVVAAGTLAGVAGAARNLRRRRRGRARAARTGAPATLAMLAAGVAVAVSTLAALAPECEVDSLIHHLPVAARTIALGRLVPMPGNAILGASAPSELLRGWAMALGGEPAGRLFGPAAVVLGAILLVGALGPTAWGWAAAALFATHGTLVALAASSKPDVLLAPLGLAVCLLAARRQVRVAALLLGSAVAMKIVAVEFAAAVAAVLAVGRAWRGARPAALPAGLAFPAGLALLPWLPWLVSGWMLTGNPFFPAGFAAFGGLGLTPRIARTLSAYLAGVAHVHPYATLGQRATALWSLAFAEGASPLLLGLLPLALITASRRGGGGNAEPGRWVLAAFVVIWSLGPIQARYLAPGIGVAILLGLRRLAEVRAPWAPVLAGLVIAVQVAELPRAAPLAGALPAGLGLESRDAAFSRRWPEFAAALRAMGGLPPGARVLVVGSDAAYPAVRPLLAASRVEPFQVFPLIRESATPSALWRRMRRLRVTHVLYNPVEAVYLSRLRAATPWTEREIAVWAATWRAHAREIHRTPRISAERGWFVLYALAAYPPGGPELAFLPGAEAVFAVAEYDLLRGRRGDVAARLRRLDRVLGGTGSFEHFVARFVRGQRPGEAFTRLTRAEATGYRDPALDEDLAGFRRRR